MSKRVTQEELLSRFYRNYPEAEIEVIEYTAISKKAKFRCRCGKYFQYERARELLSKFSCCGSNSNLTKIEKLKMLYDKSEDFEFIKQIDKDHFIVHHNKCGQDIARVISNSLDNPFACRICGTHRSSQKLDINEVQTRLDERFGGEIKILDYLGQLEKNHYKCLKCGLIFTQQQTSLMQSRGCPKCDRYQSNGERQMRLILQQNEIRFKEQISVSELPLQHFDFGVYDSDDNLLYYIEIQGEQHREERQIFRDGLEKIRERDERKRKYCLSNNIPLYEIVYQKGKLLNLDILPFWFNDYLREGEYTISV